MTERTRYVNNGRTSLDGSIDAVTTTLTVVDAETFPTEGNFIINIDGETFKVTTVTGNVFTILRGQLGTVPNNHLDGALVKTPLCASTLTEYAEQHYVYGQDTPAFTITNPATGLFANVADFTFVNQGGATAVDRDGKILVTTPPDAGEQFRGLFLAAPSTPYEIVMAWSHQGPRGGVSTTSPFPQSELVFRESGTGKMMSLAFMPRDGADRAQVKQMDSPTSFNASVYWEEWQFGIGPVWAKIADDGVDLTFHVSINGVDFLQVFSQARTSFMAGGPDQVGFGTNPSASIVADTMIEILHFGKVD